MGHITWEQLPAEARAAVEKLIGPVVKVEAVREGRRSAVAVIVHTGTGRAFIKGAPREDATAAAQLDREAAVGALAATVAPPLVLDVTVGGWRLLGHEVVDGQRASLSPGSPDVQAVVEALAHLGSVTVPAENRGGLLWFEKRWSHYAPAARDLAALAGATLLHTDLNPGNILVAGGRASLVDWGMASIGAGYANPADLVINLIAAGHHPRDAEAAVAGLPAWASTAPETLDGYARLIASTWLYAFWSIRHPWTDVTVAAAQRWALHRRGTL
ncbi:phosphotransferase [Actinomadura roseirufa]|uniref:phosphotransferase n=1 Tax=Actinomadura roseirufa TaxID=2094049 RepID=UPI0010413922|nr:phosphotransferase [Actinomadura roseirufa]